MAKQLEPLPAITFSELSGWLKFAIIISWVTAGIWAISFLVGFFGVLLR